MPQPSVWTRLTNFLGYATANPSATYPPALIDQEFDAARTTVQELRTNIALIQRDDGRLKNGSVHPDSLSAATRVLISDWNPRGDWATATVYALKDVVEEAGVWYVCIVAHTSGASFAVDLAAARWMAINLDMGSLANTTDVAKGDFLLGTRLAATGAVGRTQHQVNEDVARTTAGFGVTTTSTPTVNATALTNALAEYDEITVSAGTYNTFEITASNKTLHMESGVIFKIPDGTVPALSSTGPDVLKISGSNVNIFGDFTVDGNAANNNSASFPSSEHVAALKITGDNCVIHDTVHLLNPYYIGLSVDGGNDTGDEVEGTRIKYVKITNPKHYATLLWTMDDWEIGTIEVIAGANGTDQRIRTGTQSTSTGQCLNGVIHRINTERSVVVENKTNGLYLPSVKCKAIKFEESFGIRFGTIDVYDAGDSKEQFGFAIIDTDNIQGGDVYVADFNGTASGRPAWIATTETCDIKSIVVDGTIANVQDFTLRSADELKIGLVVCKNPVGTGNGFLYDFDAGYAPQSNIRIGAILSSGHTTTDIGIESGGDFLVQYINSDAVTSGVINQIAHPSSADWVPTYVTSGVGFDAVTYDGITSARYVKIGRMVCVSGLIRTDSITVGGATGNVLIGGLPFAASSGNRYYSAAAIASVTAFAGDHPVNARVQQGGTVIELYYRTTSNGADTALAVADLGTGANANTLAFSATYFTDS